MQRKCIDLENEIRGLLKVFGVKLPMRLARGAFDAAVRDTIENDPALSHALLPMLQARQMLIETFSNSIDVFEGQPAKTLSACGSWASQASAR